MRRSSWLPLPALPVTAVLTVAFVLPVGLVLVYSFLTPTFFGVEWTLTLDNYRAVLESDTMRSLLARTLGIGLLCATLIVALAFVLAYVLTFKLRRWGTAVILIVAGTLLGGSYLVRIFAWSSILGNRGIVNSALTGIGVIDQPASFLFFGYFAIVVTLTYVYLPLALLVVYAGLQGIDRSVLSASRDLGAGRWRTLTQVTIPLAAPGLRVAFALVFILTTADYVTPQLVGGVDGQMVGNLVSIQFGGAANYPLGAALAVTLVVAMALVLLALRGLGALLGVLRARLPAPRPRARRARRLQPPAVRVPWPALATVAFLVFLLLPLALVILFSFNTTSTPGLPLRGFTTDWYSEALGNEAFHDALRSSLTVAGLAVLGSVLLGVPAAIGMAGARYRLRRVLGVLVLGPVAVPGVVVGVALLTASEALSITTGVLLTALAHTLLGVPFVILIVQTRMAGIDPNLGEAARDLGAGALRVFSTITLPLLGAAIAASALLVCAFSLDDVIVANFTTGASPTVPVWILGLIRRELDPGVNAVAVLILVLLTLLIGAAAAIAHRARGGLLGGAP